MFENILFVRRSEELKEKWSTLGVNQASQMRRTLMSSCLKMARKNLYNDFRPRDPEDMCNADLVTDADGNPLHPLRLLKK